MAKFNFRLVMPERELLATEADMVVVPGSEGDFGVLHGHAPLISTVRPGVLEVYQGSKADDGSVTTSGVRLGSGWPRRPSQAMAVFNRS